MSQAEHLIYTVRPNGCAIWLPALLAGSLGLGYGARIPREIYEGHEIQGLIARRLEVEKSRAKR